MNYGMYISASGMIANLYRMDVYANNLANMNTDGFKPDAPAIRQRDSAHIEDGLSNLPSNIMMDKLSAGVMLSPTRPTVAQGALRITGGNLDVAIKGAGYLVLRDGEGYSPETVRFTRDGQMAINPQGQLVQATSGYPVLDTSDRPITLSPGQVVDIDSDGIIRQEGRVVARLQIATVSDPYRLRKIGNNLMTGPAAMVAKRQPSTATVEQGWVEQSTVDPVRTMIDLSEAERAVQLGVRMIQYADELTSRAVSTFGKVA